MNYNLNSEWAASAVKPRFSFKELKRLFAVGASERKGLFWSLLILLLNTCIGLCGPLLMGYTIDHYIQARQFDGVLMVAGILLVLYVLVFGGTYIQTLLMGGAGQRIIFKLRNGIFEKIQALPVAFFNQNKAGDLISRVNADTERLSQFFSAALLQFVSSIVTLIAAGLFLLCLNLRLGLLTIFPAVFIWALVYFLSPWLRKRNEQSMKSYGLLFAAIQENLHNFKVIIAFNRRDYFRKRLAVANQDNYKIAIKAGLANTVFVPVFGLFTNAAQLIVLVYGVYLIRQGSFSVGLLISYLAYTAYFYNPIRQLAALWTSLQTALASWDRISGLMALENDLEVVSPVGLDVSGRADGASASAPVLEFKNVRFGYASGQEVLHGVSLVLESGKTYAFVGPTGGGKTTTASLMARLYDPLQGVVLLNGRDIRSYTPAARASKIGFILQEPLLFTGTVRENILYGNSEYSGLAHEGLFKVIDAAGIADLLLVFEDGLDTKVGPDGSSMSLGQKQLIAFMRAFLRNPELLILDEATANIDTVTERMLERVLAKLPSSTTLVVIAHRLNTIENADEIFFVNAGQVERAGSFKDAVERLMQGVRVS